MFVRRECEVLGSEEHKSGGKISAVQASHVGYGVRKCRSSFLKSKLAWVIGQLQVSAVLTQVTDLMVPFDWKLGGTQF
jgi:hypothetical protein